MVKVCLSMPFGDKKATGFSLEELFSFAKETGFDGIEYLASLQDLFIRPKHVLELSKKYSLPVLSLHQPIYLIFYSPSIIFSQMITLAAYFPDLLVTNNHLSSTMLPFINSEKSTKKLFQLGKQKNINFSFESNPIRSYLSLYPAVTTKPELYGNFCVKNKLPMTMDMSHISHNNYSILEFFKSYHASISLIHLSDYKDGIEHLTLGKGNLPLEEVFIEIKKTKWNGVITFETANFRGMKTKEEKKKALKNSLKFVRKYV